MHTVFHIFFYAAALVLFILDICFFALLEQHLVYSLLCLYCITITQPTVRPARVIVIGLLLMLESFTLYGFFSLALLYIIPITFASSWVKRFLYIAALPRYLLLIVALLLQCLIVQPLFYCTALHLPYTFWTLFVNIGVMLLFP
jgi:hypothetical protein